MLSDTVVRELRRPVIVLIQPTDPDIKRLFAGVAQLVEHNLAKVGVAGSNPVARSISIRSNAGSKQ